MNNNTKIKHDNQFVDYLKNKGKKLGFLIGNSALSNNIKQELIELLSKMNVEQIDRLIRIFEAKFINDQTGKIDNEFKVKIEKMINGFKDKERRKKEDLISSIEKFNKNISI
jgi:hypothetical protein